MRNIREVHDALAIRRTIEPVRREEYLDYMTFQALIPPMITEIFGPLPGLKEEWAAQGAAPEELDFSTFRYRCGTTTLLPVNTGWMDSFPEEVLEETKEFVIAIDRMGRRVKLSRLAASLPLPLEYPVKNMDDWLRMKPHYEFSEKRFGRDWERRAQERRAAGDVIMVAIPGGFDEPRQLMGDEGVCLAFYDQPELIYDILKTIGDTAVRVLDRVSAAVQVDALAVHEDMAGKSGPLAGPKQIEEFIAPYYGRVWDMLRDRGARLFDQDSDGNMNAAFPAFVAAGLNMTHPLEPAAGMDIVQLRSRYGRKLAFVGGLDKHVVRRSREEIVAELEYKIPPMVRTGGCVLGLDHRIPNGTPLANYRFYLQKAWEIMDREWAAVSGA
jgi:hypothetical protein